MLRSAASLFVHPSTRRLCGRGLPLAHRPVAVALPCAMDRAPRRRFSEMATPTSRLGRGQLLLLYRRILKAAAQFPSVKRDSIIRDIKLEFRDNAIETDISKIEEQHANAQRSYTQLLLYCGFDPEDPDWELTTAENPMPQ